MNDNTFVRKKEIEISLGDLFWSVLRHWRGIILFMLVFAVLLGGYGFIKEYKAYNDPDALQRRTAAYNQAAEEYNTKKEKLTRDIKSSEEYQTRLEDIKDRCIYLRFDPYNIYTIETTYFVDSNYEIDPSLSYQNINNTSTLVKSYKVAIQRVDLDTVIDMDGEDLTRFHPVSKYSGKNILTLTADDNAGLIVITITADTKERAEKIHNEIRTVIDNTKAALTTAVGEHELSVVNETALYTVDWDYEALQKSFMDDYYEKNKTSIINLKKQLNSLEAPGNTVPSKESSIRQGIKKGIIGLIIGLVVAVVVYILRFVLQDRVYTPDEIRGRYRLPVLGIIDLGLSKRRAVKLDKEIASRLGVSKGLSTEQSADLIASNIKLYIKDASKLLLIGSAGLDATEKLKEKLQPLLGGTVIVSAGDVNLAPEAVNALTSDIAIVCVEEWQKACHLDIIHELEKVSAVENKGIGFVVVY